MGWTGLTDEHARGHATRATAHMNRTQLTSLVVALACFGAVGVSASTLSSTVAADPSDALDPDYEVIPVAGDGLAQLEAAVAGGTGGPEPGGDDGPERRAGGSGSSDDQAESDAGDSEESANAGDGEGDAEKGQGGSGDSGGGGAGDGTSRVPGERFTLVDLLTLLVLAGLVVATAWLCYRYRDRFRGLFTTEEPPAEDDPRPVPDGPPADDNLVFEAWDDLLSDLDVDRPETLTTRECADAAAAAGFDRTEIERLRLDFEAVRYGGLPVTDSRRRRARSARKRLGLNGESP
ncbi:DUF4129 domain-containing protein [Halorientalis pallida]|uniref:DUF4129 domain-containing protein n=1 Tax=Halorientalis pallida TaxID=2479928 RepID=UPI003C6F28DF